jgi:hypothetical protein
MFETIAVLSTLSCIAIFAGLLYMDRKGRREESAATDDSTPR